MVAKFWVGGAGTWDTTTQTHWSTTTGPVGNAPQAVPTTADTVTFDGNSGGGTVLVASNIVSPASISAAAFTGTLDFSNGGANAAGTPVLTLTGSTGLTLAGTGSGRQFNLGSAIFNFVNCGYDFSVQTGVGATPMTCGAATFNMSVTGGSTGSQQQFAGGPYDYSSATINAIARPTGNGTTFILNPNTGFKIGTLNVNGPCYTVVTAAINITINNLALNGAIGAMVTFLTSTTQANQTTLLTACTLTGQYALLRGINIPAATSIINSGDLGNNTNLTVTPPTAGGGGHIIGA